MLTAGKPKEPNDPDIVPAEAHAQAVKAAKAAKAKEKEGKGEGQWTGLGELLM